MSRRLRLGGVHRHFVSPDRPIRRSTTLPMEAAYPSEQARDRILLRVESITKQYADQAVLSEVTFDIRAGEILGIIGPNGAGNPLVARIGYCHVINNIHKIE